MGASSSDMANTPVGDQTVVEEQATHREAGRLTRRMPDVERPFRQKGQSGSQVENTRLSLATQPRQAVLFPNHAVGHRAQGLLTSLVVDVQSWSKPHTNASIRSARIWRRRTRSVPSVMHRSLPSGFATFTWTAFSKRRWTGHSLIGSSRVNGLKLIAAISHLSEVAPERKGDPSDRS